MLQKLLLLLLLLMMMMMMMIMMITLPLLLLQLLIPTPAMFPRFPEFHLLLHCSFHTCTRTIISLFAIATIIVCAVFNKERSRALGTYALCGFCSLSTIAIAIGVWDAICPQRKEHFKKLMFRVLIQANISCFTTACVAGT